MCSDKSDKSDKNASEIKSKGDKIANELRLLVQQELIKGKYKKRVGKNWGGLLEGGMSVSIVIVDEERKDKS